MDGERGQVVGETRGSRWIGVLELTDECPEAALGCGLARRLVERRPVRSTDSLDERGLRLRQLLEHIPKSTHGAAATIGVGPELADRLDQPRCASGDALAAAYRLPAFRAATPEEVAPVIAAARAADTPALIHFRIADEQNVFPFMPAGAGLSDLLEE